jgi:hypothetical protein
MINENGSGDKFAFININFDDCSISKPTVVKGDNPSHVLDELIASGKWGGLGFNREAIAPQVLPQTSDITWTVNLGDQEILIIKLSEAA